MVPNSRDIERVSKLGEQVEYDDFGGMSVEDCWAMMWQMTIDSWAMKGVDIAEQEFQRHVERVERIRR